MLSICHYMRCKLHYMQLLYVQTLLYATLLCVNFIICKFVMCKLYYMQLCICNFVMCKLYYMQLCATSLCANFISASQLPLSLPAIIDNPEDNPDVFWIVYAAMNKYIRENKRVNTCNIIDSVVKYYNILDYYCNTLLENTNYCLLLENTNG